MLGGTLDLKPPGAASQGWAIRNVGTVRCKAMSYYISLLDQEDRNRLLSNVRGLVALGAAGKKPIATMFSCSEAPHAYIQDCV